MTILHQPMDRSSSPLLSVRDLKMHFRNTRGLLRRQTSVVKAVDGVSLDIGRGETLALVGESGSGKTTLGRCVLRVYQPNAGTILFDAGSGAVDLATLPADRLKPYRADIRMIFQDPNSSLNPRRSVLDIISEPLQLHKGLSGQALTRRVAELLEQVGLRSEYMSRFPHAFSGGERQRIGIARALTLDPKLIVCDESVSALDVSVKAQILNLLKDLQEQMGLAYLFITHDLGVVDFISDRICVMYAGRLVEIGPTRSVMVEPRHPYTRALLSAVPRLDPRQRNRQNRVRLAGDVADPANLPAGCHFHPRCPLATERCRAEQPILRRVTPDMEVACHYA